MENVFFPPMEVKDQNDRFSVAGILNGKSQLMTRIWKLLGHMLIAKGSGLSVTGGHRLCTGPTLPRLALF